MLKSAVGNFVFAFFFLPTKANVDEISDHTWGEYTYLLRKLNIVKLKTAIIYKQRVGK